MSEYRNFDTIRARMEEAEELATAMRVAEHEAWLEEQAVLASQPHRDGFGEKYTCFMESDHDDKDEDNEEDIELDEEEDQEDQKEDEEDMDEDGSADENSDNDDNDLSGFGDHGGSDLPHNEYDPKEVETLSNLMASEADAMNEYLDAARESRVDVLQRLYADIANEERFHMEQLLFAKSELTGEKYVPRDKDVRKEYEELLALGMDEETAMTTAVDKVGISVKIEDTNDEDLVKEMAALESDFELLEMMATQISLVSYVCERYMLVNDETVKNDIMMIQEHYYQEEVVGGKGIDKQYQKWAGNPLKIIWDLFKNFLKFLHDLSKNSQKFMIKMNFKIDKLKKFIAKHGIEGLFANGVMLYLWNDSLNRMDYGGAAYYVNNLWALTKIVAQMTGDRNEQIISKLAMYNGQPFSISDPNYKIVNMKPKAITKFLDSVILTKTKVVVNEKNKEYIQKTFFGEQEKYQFNSQDNIDVSKTDMNAFVLLSYMVARIEIFSKYAEELTAALGKLESYPNSIFHTSNEKFNECVKYMNYIVKKYTQITKCVQHDMSAIAKLCDGVQPEAMDNNPNMKQNADGTNGVNGANGNNITQNGNNSQGKREIYKAQDGQQYGPYTLKYDKKGSPFFINNKNNKKILLKTKLYDEFGSIYGIEDLKEGGSVIIYYHKDGKWGTDTVVYDKKLRDQYKQQEEQKRQQLLQQQQQNSGSPYNRPVV